jgi:hypothetical protein
MKRLLSIGTVVAASLLAASTLMGADRSMGATGGKDVCLLVAKQCATNVDSISQRIERLNHEIGKGSAVYTHDELKVLKERLDEALRMLGDLTSG